MKLTVIGNFLLQISRISISLAVVVKNKDLREPFQLTNAMIINSPEMKLQLRRILV